MRLANRNFDSGIHGRLNRSEISRQDFVGFCRRDFHAFDDFGRTSSGVMANANGRNAGAVGVSGQDTAFAELWRLGRHS